MLADFIAEFTVPKDEEIQDGSILWMIHTDDSSVQKMGGVGVIIPTPEGNTLKYGIQFQFPATNNKAKYEEILTGLKVAKALGAKSALLKSDSRLVIGHINMEFEAKENKMQKYLKLTNQLIRKFDQVSFVQVPQDQNSEEDEVARYASLEDKTSLANLI